MFGHTDHKYFVTPSSLESLWKGLGQFNVQIRTSQDSIRSSKQRNDRSINS